MITVVRGNPTPEELAAALTVVRARLAAGAAGAADGRGPRPLRAWSDPARALTRGLPTPGPHAWRTSLWPA
ncbi:acyl-CoA carboxylase subunit epsilon [Streptomyces avicenniae]|uniref:acyl-CoA carboxylase subunit epsilon n=1 Tax=Streptomyces avicenniae TaxID=500153 RepID=UPI00069AB212|nr:acyl-CoA carboxylase subunit epsilon [Streptomyces avicenniae]